MPFYDSIYTGIVRCQLNEQFLFKIFSERDMCVDNNTLKTCACRVEDVLNCWDWQGRSLNLVELILSELYKIRHAK